MKQSVQIIPVRGLPLLKKGDRLAQMIVNSLAHQGTRIRSGDVLVVGQKAVSKVEGRIRRLEDVRPSNRAVAISRRAKRKPAFVQLVLQDTRQVARAGRDALVVTTKQGFTCLNGGVDKSNIKGDENYALLPANPDLSARKIRSKLYELTGKIIAVIVCDTNSRPFRRGQVEHAIGVCGLRPLVDYRGRKDLFGYELKFKNVAVADELASAAELVMGQGREMTPAALIRGVTRIMWSNRGSSKELTVSRRQDLFRGTL